MCYDIPNCDFSYFPDVSSSQVTLDHFPFDYSEEDVINNAESYEQTNLEMMSDISFHCSTCSYQTSIESLYDRHVSKHALVAPHLCPSCPYADVDHSTFVDHMMTHQQSKLLRCNFCNYRSIANSMRTHMLKHRSIDMLDCSMCEFSTNYANAMKHHVEAYHMREHVCDMCENVMSKYSLIKHAWNAHGVVIKTKLKSLHELGYGIDESELDSVKSEPDFDCDMKEDVCDDPPVSNTKQDKYDGKWIGKFDCEFCDFTTKYFYSKKFHVEKFHVKLFLCGHCENVMTKHELAVHYKEVHGQDINLKHSRRFVEISDPHSKVPTAEPNQQPPAEDGPSIVESVKSASRKPRKQFGIDKSMREAKNSFPSSQEITEEPSSASCEPSVPFVLSIAEAVKSKSRKAKRKNSAPKKSDINEIAPALEPLSPKETHNPDIGTSVEDYFASQEMPSLEPEMQDDPGFLYCSKCTYKTKFRSVLKHHVVAHLPHNNLVCSKCDFASDVNYEFARHLKSHSEGDTVRCCFCSYSVASRALGNLSNHLGTHRKIGMFFCTTCNYSCAVKCALKDHNRVHHSEKHQCPRCSQVGTRFRILKHLKKCHPGVSSKLISASKIKPTKDENLPVYANGIRDEENPSSEVLIESASTGLADASGGVERTDPGNSVESSDQSSGVADQSSGVADQSSRVADQSSGVAAQSSEFAASKASNPRSKLRSQDAAFEFPGASDTTNEKTDTGNPIQSLDQTTVPVSSAPSANFKPGRFYCSECPYNTKNKHLLRQHVAKHLLEGSFFTCPVCHIKENNPFEFVLHLKSHEIKLMTCCYCSYGFRSAKGIVRAYASHLEAHRPVHFIDCPNCEKTFKRIHELRNHFYTNHVCKRICPECNKRMTRYQLLRHMVKHKAKKKPKRRRTAAPKIDLSRFYPSTSQISCVDGTVGESFGVPLSPKCSLNLASSQECSLYWNPQDTYATSQVINQTQSDNPNPENVPNSVENFSDTGFEDPTNVPIFDISGAPSVNVRVAPIETLADSPNRRKTANVQVLKNSSYWDSLGINIFDLARNSKNGDSGSSEGTATVDEDSDHDGVTKSGDQTPHFLDHNYAAKPKFRKKKF